MPNIPIWHARTEPATPSPAAGLGRTLILALGTFAVGTDAFVLAAFLPELATTLGVSTATAGLSMTVFAGAYALLSPVLASATARMPRRSVLVIALVVLAAANLGSAMAPSFAVLIATRVLAAVGAAAYTPNAGAVAAALVPVEMRGRALAIVIGGLTIATALGVPLGGVVGQWLGWRSALAMVAAMSMVAAAGVAVLVPYVSAGPRVPLRTRFAVLRNRTVAAVLPLTTLGMAAAYVVYAYSVPALAALGIGTSSTTWMLAMYGVGAVAGNLLAGYATDRWGAVRVLSVGYLAMATSMAGMAGLSRLDTHVPLLVALLAVVWGAASWCQTPPQQHRLIGAAPHDAGLVVALNASCIYVGIGVGTVLGGIASVSGAGAMYGLSAGMALAALTYLRVTASLGPSAR